MKPKSREIIRDIKSKKGGDSKTVSYRLPTYLANQFASICEKEGVSANSVVIRLIQDFVAGLK